MKDVRLIELARRQHNRVSRAQLLGLGYSDAAIEHRLATGRLVTDLLGVYAIPPVLDHADGRWMAATLTAPETFLSHASAGAAAGFRPHRGTFETVTRPGNGGPRRHGAVFAFRSSTLQEDTTTLRGIPITTGARTLLDLAPHLDDRALAKATREALRLGATTHADLAAMLERHRGRRGAARLANVAARLKGLPLHRARSDAESHALEILKDAGRVLPHLNRRIGQEEADLSWPAHRLVIEVDGPQYHRDRAEDARKTRAWKATGHAVLRIPSGDVFDAPQRLLDLAPPAEDTDRP